MASTGGDARVEIRDSQGGILARANQTPFSSVSLAFVNLNYRVTVGRGKEQKEKSIISNANGYIQPGTFVAIMGPSGSGKTSLLNILAGRVVKSKAVLEGQILVNGEDRDRTFKRISAYVLQDDILFSQLTVWETLMTAAMLRLPNSMPRDEKIRLAESIITELGLGKARNTPIGNNMVRGVSGGERKRTNIAVELLSNPSLLFLDEPTSGLDSFQALNVMSSLSDLSKSGRTVISTIHQPRSSIYTLFENLMLLSEGSMIYFGKASDAVHYFEERGFLCPPLFNPADYFLDVISLDRRDEQKEIASSERIKLLSESYSPAESVRPDLHVKSILNQRDVKDDAEKLPKYAASWFTQFQVLTRRAWWQMTRSKLPLIIAFVQAIVMLIVVSILYSDIGKNQKSIQDRQGVIFFICIFFAFNGVFQMITTFPAERGIINRERASNSYKVSAYYPAKVLTELPIRICPILVFCIIGYWTLKFQRTAEKFFVFIVVAILEFAAMNATGILVSSVAPTPETALALGPLATVIFMLFGGFYVNLDTIPKWISWFKYCSPIHWGFIGLGVNEFRGLKFECDSSTSSCIKNGYEVLSRLSIEKYSLAEAIGYQAIVIVVLNFLSYLALFYNRPQLQPVSKLASQSSITDVKIDEKTNENN